MKPALALFLIIVASGTAAAQDEDFHHAKFPAKPEAIYQAANRAITQRHPKDHWITLRDDDHLELHVQTKVTLANIGYRMVLTVKPDGGGSVVQIDAERIPVKHGVLFATAKRRSRRYFGICRRSCRANSAGRTGIGRDARTKRSIKRCK